jgi:hypothetical protein
MDNSLSQVRMVVPTQPMTQPRTSHPIPTTWLRNACQQLGPEWVGRPKRLSHHSLAGGIP